MAKKRSKQKRIRALQKAAKRSPQERLERLIEQERYIQALDLVRQHQRDLPDAAPLTPSEGQLLLAIGQEELEQSQYKAADARFARALALASPQDDWLGEAYYRLAKSLVLQDRCAEALDFIQTAFEQGKLPKPQCGCYLKLLLIQGQAETVKRLIEEQPRRFYATQLHWARGILALQEGEPDAAIAHFRKGKDPATPGDMPKAWPVYARQCQSDWPGASTALGQLRNSLLSPYRVSPYRVSPDRRSPALNGADSAAPSKKLLEWIDLNQRVGTGRFQRSIFERRQGIEVSPTHQLLELVGLLETDRIADAGETFLSLDASALAWPELQAIRSPLMKAAGDRAVATGDLDGAVEFWQQVAAEKPLDFQLNVNLLHLYDELGMIEAFLPTIQCLMHWVENEASKQGWPKARCNEALVHLYCSSADAYMYSDKGMQALKALKQAERIEARHAEVLARRGLVKAADGDRTGAISLLTEALEKGTQFEEAYDVLLRCLEKAEGKAAQKEARRRFGKRFGDIVEAEIDTDLPRWLEAVSTQRYLIFESLIHPEDAEGPEELACGHFREAVEGEPTQSGRVAVDLATLTAAWDALLQELSVQEQAQTLEAICLCLLLFCKRIKGRDALTKRYQEQLLQLESDWPEALRTYLVLSALKNTAAAIRQMQPHLERYLKRSPEPGTALAQLQLKARWFGEGNALQPAIETALKKEPQNPQLLLAKATFYAPQSNAYERQKDQGFEIARRLQDAAALQAFRDEQVFVGHWQTIRAMPKNLRNFEPTASDNLDYMLEQMIRNMLGPKMSEQELRSLMPMLKEQLLNEMALEAGFEFTDDSPPPIELSGPPPSRRGGQKKSSARRRKR